ncbi:MAG: shikimate kinase [Chloroflexota bacterium]
MNVYLAGMIGSGKTTVGRILAQKLGWSFHDLDVAIEALTGKTFRQLVADEGWLRFREVEYHLCKQFASLDQAVVGLGGGTVRYEWNRDALRGSGIVVVLVADLKVLADRVRANDRPRVNPGTNLEEDLEAIWASHRETYLSSADIVYRTDQGKSAIEEADEILELLAKRTGIAPGHHQLYTAAQQSG